MAYRFIKKTVDFYDDRKVDELAKFITRIVSIQRLKGKILIDFREVYESYAENVGRVYDLAALPFVIAVSGAAAGTSITKAKFVATGSFDPEPLTPEQSEDVRLLATPVYHVNEESVSDREFLRRWSAVGRHVIEKSGKRGERGLDVTMRAMIVLAWSSYERLTEDLCLQAVRLMPNSLGALRGRSKKRVPFPYERSYANTKKNKTPSDLKFRTVEAIRDSYGWVFHKGYRHVDRALNHRSIDTLSATRNLLVHTGGKVDDFFLFRVAGMPQFASACRGAPLHLDFELVKWMIDPVIARGINLIAAVSKWIEDHPDARPK